MKSLKVQIVEQLHGSGQDLSKIQQRLRAKAKAQSPIANRHGEGRRESGRRPGHIPRRKLPEGSRTLPKRSPPSVLALVSLSNPARRGSRKRGRSDDDTTLAERVKKLAQQTKIPARKSGGSGPVPGRGILSRDGKTKAYGIVQQVEPPRLSEKDDEFVDLIQALL